jgi:hypothetical protein
MRDKKNKKLSNFTVTINNVTSIIRDFIAKSIAFMLRKFSLGG